MNLKNYMSRIIPRPEVTIIRCNPDYAVGKWNVPPSREDVFFYCYYSYTPNAAKITANGVTHILGNENFIIIPPGLTHQIEQLAPFRHLFIHFVASTPFNNLKEIVSIPAAPHLSCLEDAKNPLKQNLALYSLLYRLLLELPYDRMNTPREKDRDIERVINIIRTNPAKTPLLEDLARQVNMSVSSLSHRFKDFTGLSPAQYALQFRLEYAFLLLADIDAPDIESIAEMCGFANRYHLSKQFKKQYGMAPGQMRRYLQKEKSVF